MKISDVPLYLHWMCVYAEDFKIFDFDYVTKQLENTSYNKYTTRFELCGLNYYLEEKDHRKGYSVSLYNQNESIHVIGEWSDGPALFNASLRQSIARFSKLTFKMGTLNDFKEVIFLMKLSDLFNLNDFNIIENRKKNLT